MWRSLSETDRDRILSTWPQAKLVALRREIEQETLPELRAAWRSDPVRWAMERTGTFLWSKQREVAVSVATNKRTAVPSGAGLGKSYLAALLILWWVDTHTPGKARCGSTSVTSRQLRGALWQETSLALGRLRERHEFPGKLNLTEFWVPTPAGLFLAAFGTVSSSQDASGIQGLHAEEGVLFIVEEAAGVHKNIFDAVDRNTTNDTSRVLAIGNPTIATCHFRKLCESSLWNTITLSTLDSPVFTGEEVPSGLLDALPSRQWVEDQRVGGEDTVEWLAGVCGQFVNDDQNSVISRSLLEAARLREIETTGPIRMGVDVGGGGDWTAVTIVQGFRVLHCEKRRTPDRLTRADWILTLILQWQVSSVKIDAIGIGDGVVTPLQQWQAERRIPGNVAIHPVNVGQAPYTPGYMNLRAELHYEFAAALPWLDLSVIPEEAVTDLASPRRKMNVYARHAVESKEDIRKRLGRSPDLGDSILLAFFEPPTQVTGGVPTGGDVVGVSAGSTLL